MSTFKSSQLTIISNAFTALERHRSLTINGAKIHDVLPQREIHVTELPKFLLHRSTPYEARDAALAVVASRAQTEGDDWTIAILGNLIPGMRSIMRHLSTHNCSIPDTESHVIDGVLTAIAKFDFSRPQSIASRLLWAGFRSGFAFRTAEMSPARFARLQDEPLAAPGHPDLVLANAVNSGVLTSDQAWLIGETRLGKLRISELAKQCRVKENTLIKRRRRAECTLRAYLQQQN